VFTDPLPNNRLPIVARICLLGNVFIESLPSNGYTRHNIATDLLKALLGHGLINTPRYVHATIACSSLLGSGQGANELAVWRSRDVFSVGPARAPMDWRGSEHVTCFLCVVHAEELS
jgi:hypothetical protein